MKPQAVSVEDYIVSEMKFSITHFSNLYISSTFCCADSKLLFKNLYSFRCLVMQELMIGNLLMGRILHSVLSNLLHILLMIIFSMIFWRCSVIFTAFFSKWIYEMLKVVEGTSMLDFTFFFFYTFCCSELCLYGLSHWLHCIDIQ